MVSIEHAGAALRERRAQLGWSAEELARRARAYAQEAGDPIKLTQQSISGFEVGKSKRIPRWLHYAQQALDDAKLKNATQIASRLRQIMKERHLSVLMLAKATGTSLQTIQSVLHSEDRCNEYLPAIADALNVPISWLRGDQSQSETAQPLPLFQSLQLTVLLPNERALTEMFEGLLSSIGPNRPMTDVAAQLAQLLPNGLMQLQSGLIDRG